MLKLACVAGVNGGGEREQERGRKMGFLRARDEGTPATKTPLSHLRSSIFR